jgi:hypothetical protein
MIQHLNDSMIQYPKAMPLVPENRSPLSCLGREAAEQESPLRIVALSLPDAPPAECNGLHNPAPRTPRPSSGLHFRNATVIITAGVEESVDETLVCNL